MIKDKSGTVQILIGFTIGVVCWTVFEMVQFASEAGFYAESTNAQETVMDPPLLIDDTVPIPGNTGGAG